MIGKGVTDQPMPSGKANIQSANPPPNLKPKTSTIIAKLSKSEEKAKNEPREQHDKGGFQEHSLGLGKLLD